MFFRFCFVDMHSNEGRSVFYDFYGFDSGTCGRKK